MTAKQWLDENSILLISKWMEQYGKEIQREVIRNVMSNLKECGLKNVRVDEIANKLGIVLIRC